MKCSTEHPILLIKLALINDYIAPNALSVYRRTCINELQSFSLTK